MPNHEGLNTALIDMATKALEKGADLTQSEADTVMSFAMMCNPSGNGYVRMLKDDLRRIAPHIDLRED